MMIYLIPLIYIIGWYLSKKLIKKYNDNNALTLYTGAVYWITYFITSIIAAIVYFATVSIENLKVSLSYQTILFVLSCIVIVLVLCELGSPSNRFKGAFIRKKDEVDGLTPTGCGRTHSEKDYSVFLKIISDVMVTFIISALPIYLLGTGAGNLLSASPSISGKEIWYMLSAIIGVCITCLIPICLRQVFYSLRFIKGVSMKDNLINNQKKSLIVNKFLKSKNKNL